MNILQMHYEFSVISLDSETAFYYLAFTSHTIYILVLYPSVIIFILCITAFIFQNPPSSFEDHLYSALQQNVS